MNLSLIFQFLPTVVVEIQIKKNHYLLQQIFQAYVKEFCQSDNKITIISLVLMSRGRIFHWCLNSGFSTQDTKLKKNQCRLFVSLNLPKNLNEFN